MPADTLRWFLVIAVLTTAVYARSLAAPFEMDDVSIEMSLPEAINFAPAIHDLGRPRALTALISRIDRRLNGLNVIGFHLESIAIHLLNGFLVFRIALRIHKNESLALWSAAFFLLHPLQTEAVIYISERPEVTSKFVYLAGILCFVWLSPENVGFLAALFAAFITATALSLKESAVTLPGMLVLYDWLFRKRPMLRWRFYLVIVALGSAGIYLFERGLLMTPLSNVPSRGVYFLTSLYVMVQYLCLVVWPVGQNLDYDIAPVSLFDPQLIMAAVVITLLLFIAWKYRTARPVYTFSILWFFVSLIPTTSFIPLPDVMFEHRMYLSVAGLALSFPVLVADLI